MKIAKKEVNSLLAMLIILMLTISDVLLIGKEAISYALDMVRTNNDNISFVAYFLDENKNKVQEIEKATSEEQELYVDVTVINEGYFNGNICIENGNFNLSQELLSDGIDRIEGNTVYLKQISAENTVTIKLKVQPITDDVITLDMLGAETQISLKGEYVNSKNIENNKYTNIESNSNVKIHWVADEEIKSNLETNIITNSITTINGEEKRLVQIEINSKLEKNNYPIKTSKFEVGIGNLKPEKVTVYAKNTSGTNSNLSFSENNYTYNINEGNINEGTVEISLENLDENKISWNRNGLDILIVSLILDKDELVQEQEIKVKSELVTYDEKDLTQEKGCFIEEELDGTVYGEIVNDENEIYKGNLYIGETREYQAETKVDVNFASSVQGLEINENEATFVTEKNNIQSEITYKSMTFSKLELINIFGEEGNITIITQEEKILLDSKMGDLVANAGGNVVLNFNEEVKQLKIYLSNPQRQGSIVFRYIKQMNNSIYNREQINQLEEINQTTTIKAIYEKGENTVNLQNNIKLMDTSSQAEFTINQENIEGGIYSNELTLMATLKQNEESQDVYLNPKLTIELPEDVTKITSAKCKLVHAENFKLENARLIDEDGRQKIEISLQGEQTSYYKEGIDGLSVVVYADLEVGNVDAPKQETVKLYYENENRPEKTYEAEEDITIMPKVKEEVETAIEENTKTEQTDSFKVDVYAARGGEVLGEILKETDTVYEGETITYYIKVTNTTKETINNIQVIGKTTNAVYYDLVPYETTFANGPVDSEKNPILIRHKYEETDWEEKKFDVIEKLDADETVTLSYQVVVKQTESENTTLKTTITIGQDTNIENVTQTVNYGEYSIKKANAKVNVNIPRNIYEEEIELKANENVNIRLNVENTSRKRFGRCKIKNKMDKWT